MNSNLSELNGKLSGIEESIEILDGKFIFESRIISDMDSFAFYIEKEGYYLIACSNGDWNAQNVMVSGFARQNDSHLVQLSHSIVGNFRVNCLWAREQY